MTPHWTKDKPTEDGFYWYREEGECEIMMWEKEMNWGVTCFNEIPYQNENWGNDLYGEFWSERLKEPE